MIRLPLRLRFQCLSLRWNSLLRFNLLSTHRPAIGFPQRRTNPFLFPSVWFERTAQTELVVWKTKQPRIPTGLVCLNRRHHFPVPFREMVCGALLAPSFTLNVAVRVPVACGVNATETVHLAFAATLPPQAFVTEKSPGSAPAKV
jgi:hypothetical protein